MKENERIDLLVKILEGDNARAFATKTGIPPSSLCRVRKGQGKPASYFGRILDAYPEVRKVWLYTGNGEPLKEKSERGEILQKIERLEREVRRLASLVEKMDSCQKSTNR